MIVFVVGIEFGSIYSYIIIVFFLRRKYDNEEVVRIMKMFFGLELGKNKGVFYY